MSLALVLSLAASLAVVQPARAAPASLTLTLSPAPQGGAVNAMTITFTVSWASGWDGSAMSNQLSDTSGHIHFMVDGTPPAMHLATSGATSTTRTFSFDLGPHEVAVELVNPNHMPYDPAVVTSASFEVALTEEGQMILDEIQVLSGSVGFLTTLLYGLLVLTLIAIVVGAVAIGQVRRIKRASP